MQCCRYALTNLKGNATQSARNILDNTIEISFITSIVHSYKQTSHQPPSSQLHADHYSSSSFCPCLQIVELDVLAETPGSTLPEKMRRVVLDDSWQCRVDMGVASCTRSGVRRLEGDQLGLLPSVSVKIPYQGAAYIELVGLYQDFSSKSCNCRFRSQDTCLRSEC